MHGHINLAANFETGALETIYHRDFHTTLVMPDNSVTTYDRQVFIAYFRRQAEQGKTRLNAWAARHDFHALGDSAVCVPTRKHSNMNDEGMKRLRNIEWRYEDGRWQVLREQMFLQPLDA